MPSTVLIVDDHSAFRTQARSMLEDDGYEVIAEAADGIGAIEAAIATIPDVILLDVQLPDISGFEVARILSERVPHSKIVLISGRDLADYGIRSAGNGALGFVNKSVLSVASLEELLGEAS